MIRCIHRPVSPRSRPASGLPRPAAGSTTAPTVNSSKPSPSRPLRGHREVPRLGNDPRHWPSLWTGPTANRMKHFSAFRPTGAPRVATAPSPLSHSIFGGEVEASNTPHDTRPYPSCRHQLSPIAHLRLHRAKAGVDRSPSAIEHEIVGLVRERIGPVAAFKLAITVARLPSPRSYQRPPAFGSITMSLNGDFFFDAVALEPPSRHSRGEDMKCTIRRGREGATVTVLFIFVPFPCWRFPFRLQLETQPATGPRTGRAMLGAPPARGDR